MKYSILTAPITTRVEPTSSLRRPFRTVTVYTEDATIFDFNTEAEAIEFAQQYLPFDKVMVLPGSRRALDFYSQVWMGAGELCQQNLPKLAAQLSDSDNWVWDYGQEMLDRLDEPDETLEEKDDPNDDSLQVGSYLMGNSLLTGKMVSLTALCDLIEWDELTEEEKLECIEPTSHNKKRVVANMGIMFDIDCRRKAGKLAKLYAYYIQYGDGLRMFHYRVTSKIQRKYDTTVLAFNKWRMRGEHP